MKFQEDLFLGGMQLMNKLIEQRYKREQFLPKQDPVEHNLQVAELVIKKKSTLLIFEISRRISMHQ